MKVAAAIVGSGNVATDLLYKLSTCGYLQPRWMIGRSRASAGLARARELELSTSADGIDGLLAQDELPALVFDATCAQAHASAAPRYKAAGIRVALEALGGAQHAHASVILDGADPPPPMRASVNCELERGCDRYAILQSLPATVADVAAYVPGYRLVAEPRFDGPRVIVLLEIEGAGDFLARHCGNLDIIPAAAARGLRPTRPTPAQGDGMTALLATGKVPTPM
jgi:acetaldehyde dehydrogenase (acetylating)